MLAVNWQTVRHDPDLKRICKGAEIEKLFAGLGVDAETINEFAVYGDPRGAGQAANGLIARGSFESSEIVQRLIKIGWTTQDIEGRPGYVDPQHTSWLTTFDKNVFVMGTEAAVREAIIARTKSQNRFTAKPEYKGLASHFEGKQYPILMMIALPQASQDMADATLLLTSTVMDLSGVGPLGDLITKIGYARALGCAISRQGELFPIAVSAVMKDEESAKFVSGALNLLKNVGGIVSKNYASRTDSNAARAIQTMSIERSRAVVSIKMAMTRRDLDAMNR